MVASVAVAVVAVDHDTVLVVDVDVVGFAVVVVAAAGGVRGSVASIVVVGCVSTSTLQYANSPTGRISMLLLLSMHSHRSTQQLAHPVVVVVVVVVVVLLILHHQSWGISGCM